MKTGIRQEKVHIHSLFIPDIMPDFDATVAWKCLSPHDRFRFFRSNYARKKELLISRYFLHKTIEQYFPHVFCNDRLSIRRDRYGKPFLFSGSERLPIYFNLAHTRGLMCCAVSLLHPLGVDAEFLDPDRIRFVRHYIAEPEREVLESMKTGRARYLYELWTLKEAFLKADGRGLGIDLDAFWLIRNLYGLCEKITVNFSEKFEHRWDGKWFFELLRPTPDHVLALAVQARSRPVVSHIVRFWEDLRV